MTDEEFESYLADSLDELQAKQDTLMAEYGFGEHGHFVVDFEAGTLTFFKDEKPVAEAAIMPLATYVPEHGSLKWAWANEVFPSAVREEAASAKELYHLTGLDLFKNEYVECDDVMVWEITAMACKCLGMAGAYRVPTTEIHTYVLMKHVGWFSQAT